MANIANLLTEHMGIWTAAETEKKSGRGRANGNAGNVYGVKKLRELILELAVRGKLVPQDPSDEPASELLKRIQAEKAKLTAVSKIKKEKSIVSIGEDEKPFALPKGWEWVHLPDVTDYKVGKTPSTKSSIYWTNDSNGYNWVSIADLNHDGVVTETSKKVTHEALKEVFRSEPVAVGSILMSFKLTLGKISILEVPAFHNEAIISIYPSPAIDKKYLFKILPARANEGDSKSAIKGNTLNSESIAALLLPLPPLAEQHRIVAKVDELMALCDQLEQQHSNAQEAHETLVSQLLSTLTQCQNAAEFNANWQGIYAHFDVLFTTEASIDALKQTLLQLAVMGILVPQDPNDEPASELLKRMQAEKAKLIAEGKLKKEKMQLDILEAEKPFELPKNWSFSYLQDICSLITDGTHLTPKYVTEGRPFISAQCIKPFRFMPERCSYVSDEHYEGYIKNRKPEYRDVLLARVGAGIGEAALIDTDLEFAIYVSTALLKPFKKHLLSEYLVLWLNSPVGRQYSRLNTLGVGVSQGNLNLSLIRLFIVSVPPLAEQHRIVAKVDALMALCDQLKTRIQQANQQQQAIADALVAQALKPATAEIIDLAAYRAAVTCNIIKRMQDNQAFGRTFAMKLLYLSQQHIGFETHLKFEREAAGPFDKWIYDFERDGVAAGWFGREERQLTNGNTKIKYQVKSAIDEPLALMHTIGSSEQREELERLFNLFADKKTEEAEIVATLFAVWNDFLLSGLSPTDEQIIQEVRENWHSSKARFSPEQLTKWLSWLRDNNIVPTGKGSKTTYQKQLIN